MPFRPVADPEVVDWDAVRQVSVVCVVEDPDAAGGVLLALYRHDGRWDLPAGPRRADEDVWDDAMLRIPLETMGFRRQETHPFALSEDGQQVAFWVTGGKYAGGRMPSADAEWWMGSMAAGASLLRAQGSDELASLVEAADESRREMTYKRRTADTMRTLVGVYLAASTPEGASGFGGSAEEWREARGVLVEALDPARTPVRFLDHACANGHLAVSMAAWAAEVGIELDPYGVDISPELVARARGDYSTYASHFFVGDALTWVHPEGDVFDVVHVLLDVVPSYLHPQLIQHQLDRVVAPGGRLVLSEYGDPPSSRSAEAQVVRAGFTVAGRTRQPIRGGCPRGFPSVWIDAP